MRACLVDALGTLVELEPPAPRLRAALAERGVEVSAQRARAAMAAEIAHYRAHHLEGRDRRSLGALRTRCTEVLRDALGPPAHGLALPELRSVLLESLRFRAFADAAPALEALRRAHVRTVVVSNWDVSLHDVLAGCGLARRVHGTITSAEVGAAKPDRRLFEHALTLAGVPASAAVHVGDRPREDVEGALAAGIEPILLDRAGAAPAPAPGVRVIGSLAELPPLAA